MTGMREAQLLEAANTLLDARRTLQPIADLPAALQPASMDEVFRIQDLIARAYEPVGGWKVGAPSLEATPMAAPMPRAWIAPSGSTLGGGRLHGLESEIAFLLARDLPPRAEPYTDEEVYSAVASCHPAIEVLESGLADPAGASRLSMLADLQMHGGFVYGEPIPDWQSIDFHQERVTLAIDGIVRVEATGSNTSGNLLRLLPWLANAGAARTGGLRAGQWITTGSWTGNAFATPGAGVHVQFAAAGPVSLHFA